MSEFAKVRTNRITININEKGELESYSVDVIKTATVVVEDRWGTLSETWVKKEESYGRLSIGKINEFIEYVKSEVDSIKGVIE